MANEVAPVAAIYQTHTDRAVVATARTPKWLFAYAGLGICAGLFLFGERVMRTVGRDATKMTPARSFNIQLGFALASAGSGLVRGLVTAFRRNGGTEGLNPGPQLQ